MDFIVKRFTWHLSDMNLCLSSNYYSTNSSSYTIGDSLCKFYLQFSFDAKAKQVSVFLCRCYDDGPTHVNVRFSLILETVDGSTLLSTENTHSFLNGDSKGFYTGMTKNDLIACLAKEYGKDNLSVICQTEVLEPRFAFLSEDIRVLSTNLLKLRSESSCANAYLIADGEKIPVHKEILSARSPVFKQKFKFSDCFLDKFFPLVVVKAMLDFLYSGDISKIDLGSLTPNQLCACAEYYKVSDLIKLMTPKRTFTTTLIERKNEVYALQLANFSTLCRTRHSVEHHGIKMQFDKDIEMNVKVLFDDYNKDGTIILETTLWNLNNVKSLIVRLFLLDNCGKKRNLEDIPLEPCNGSVSFSLKYSSEKLFSTRNLILPKDILYLNYELQFRLMREFHISDPEILEGSDCSLLNHELSSSLIRNMESLLRSEHFSDSLLFHHSIKSSVPRSAIRKVHKSILSARSPVFKDMFRTSQKISVDLSAPAVKYFLHYMYTGVLLTVRTDMLNFLHRAAEMYRINTLKRACEVIASKTPLDTKNVFPIYFIASRAELSELQKSCKDFIIKNEDIILGSFRWERLRAKNIKGFEEIKSFFTKIDFSW